MDHKLKGLWAWLLATVLLLASTAVGEGVEGGASMGTGGVNWRDLYYSFLREGAYTRSVIEAMKIDEATFHQTLEGNTMFALHDLDANGVPELLVSLYEQYASEPAAVFFYTCDRDGPKYLNGIRPGFYMYSYSTTGVYPGLAGNHRKEDGSDERVYIGLKDGQLFMELISTVTYTEASELGFREACETQDEQLYKLMSMERLGYEKSDAQILYDWQRDGLDEAGWAEYLQQWYNGSTVTEVQFLDAPGSTEDGETSVDSPKDDADAFRNVKVGGTLEFGAYEQDGDAENGAEAIEWDVLAIEGSKALIVSHRILECVPFHEESMRVDWEHCTLRQWLNEDFYSSAFTDAERARIQLTHLNNTFSMDGITQYSGADTDDYVFCLGVEDLKRYCGMEYFSKRFYYEYIEFSGRSTGMRSSLTEHAKRNYRPVNTLYWLRAISPGQTAAFNSNGISVGTAQIGNVNDALGVRPVMWIDLEIEIPSEAAPRSEFPPVTINPVNNAFETITLGTYEQDGDASNGAEPVEWLVLKREADRVLVLSRYVLDQKAFHVKRQEVTWETCDLRQWLNNDFYEKAFSAEDRQRIIATPLKPTGNPIYGVSGGNETTDNVFCLSLAEAVSCFNINQWDDAAMQGHSESTMVGATNHVLWHRDIGHFSIDGRDWDYFSQMGYTGSIPNSETKNCVWWWLRDPGNNAMNALYVNYCGSLGYRYSLSVDESKMGVRPAMWVKTS